MRILITLFFVLLAAPAAFAQVASVTGTVRNTDGKPASGVAVRLSDFRTGRVAETETGVSGEYSFSGVEPGRYIVTALESGGKRSEPTLIEVPGSVSNAADLELKTSPAITETVDVTISAGTAQPVTEVAKTVDVIDGNELDARNDVSLADSLRTVPGFRVQQLGGFGRTASIKTRGLRNQDTALLIDGMRFRDPTSITGDASAFISDVSLLSAERIEVLRGSGSSVYGTNALGGVVDIRTARPGRGVTGGFEGGFGGLGLKTAKGDVSAGTESFGFSLSGSRTVFSEGIDGEDDAKNSGLQARIDYAPGTATSISGRFLYSDASVRLNSSPDTLGGPFSGIVDAAAGVNFVPDQNDPDSIQRSDFLLGRVSLSHSFGARLLFDAAFQTLSTRRKNENGVLGPGFQPFGGTERGIFDGRVDTLSARISWTPSVTRLFVFGYEFENEEYRNEGSGPSAANSFFADSGQKSSTLFAQHLAGFVEGRLQVSAGARLQMFAVGSTGFSVENAPYSALKIETPPAAITFDGSVSYFVRSTGTRFRAHAGNGYRVPSLYERLGTFYSSYSGQFTALGDPGLEPERSVAFDAGIEQNFGGAAVVSGTYFYTRLTDIIGFGFPAPDIGQTSRPFGGYRNEKGGIARGAELSLRARPASGTYVFASYTYTNSDQRTPQVFGSGVLSTLGIPENQFTMVVTQRLMDRLTLSFDLLASDSYLAPIFSGQTFSTVLYRFEGNRRGDVSAVYEVPVLGERAKLRIRGSVQNVFDNRYFENGFRTEGRTARAGFGVEF